MPIVSCSRVLIFGGGRLIHVHNTIVSKYQKWSVPTRCGMKFPCHGMGRLQSAQIREYSRRFEVQLMAAAIVWTMIKFNFYLLLRLWHDATSATFFVLCLLLRPPNSATLSASISSFIPFVKNVDKKPLLQLFFFFWVGGEGQILSPGGLPSPLNACMTATHVPIDIFNDHMSFVKYLWRIKYFSAEYPFLVDNKTEITP